MFSLVAAVRKKYFVERLKALLSFQNFKHTVVEGGHLVQHYDDLGTGEIKFSKWRKLDSRKMGIHKSMIPQSPWIVLKVLQSAGFEAYFVGGCVRDLLLNRVPKDFDVITTAALRQIKKKFSRSRIVGKRFPICQVTIKGCVVEVSSFDTVAENHTGKENLPVSRLPKGYDEKDLTRWRNSMHRDFTVNSLFYDPFTNKIYDYVNALSDIMMSKLRTLIPAQLSFEEDCARILRGLRLAARLGMTFSEDTESAIHKLSSSILGLAKARIMMELNYMLSYGAAEPSLSLLQRFHLLEILLPLQAAHLTEQAQEKSDQCPFMLMKLFSNLDRLVSCDRPAHSSLWVAMLAFHLALVINPQQAVVVLTFGSVLYFGNWEDGVKFARGQAQDAQCYVPEISNCSDSFSDDELAEKVTKLAVQMQKSIRILTDADILLEELKKFPESPSSGLVFVSRKFVAVVDQIFEVLVKCLTSSRINRECLDVNYDSLKKGNLRELRFVLGEIIVHTMGIGNVAQRDEVIPEEKPDFYASDRQKIVDERKAHLLNKTGKKRTAYIEESVIAQEKFNQKSSSFSVRRKTKNQKVASDIFPVDIAEKKPDSVKDNTGLEITSNHQVISEGIGCILQGYASETLKNTDSHQVPRNEVQSVMGTLKFQVRKLKVPATEQKPVGDKEIKHGSGRHLKHLEQVSDGVLKKRRRSAEAESLLQQESDAEKQKAVVDYIKGDIQQNNGDNRTGNAKQKGRPWMLSSLFK